MRWPVRSYLPIAAIGWSAAVFMTACPQRPAPVQDGRVSVPLPVVATLRPNDGGCPVRPTVTCSATRGEFHRSDSSADTEPTRFFAVRTDGAEVLRHEPLGRLQWGISSTGQQLGGEVYAAQEGGTHASEVWPDDLIDPTWPVVVAVLDSAIDRQHSDLTRSFRPDRDPPDGCDNDGNGLIDDFWGMHALTLVGQGPLDPRSNVHGTMIASIIGAAYNGAGVIGVAPSVPLLDVSVMGQDGGVDAFDAYCGVCYLLDLRLNRGVPLVAVNISWGEYRAQGATRMRDALRELSAAGVVVVSAAGNGRGGSSGVNIDQQPFLPASWDLPHHIRVTGHNASSGDYDSGFNFGRGSVELSAPATHVWGAMPGSPLVGGAITGSPWGEGSGTSYAAPFVVGAIALMHLYAPRITSAQVTQCLREGVSRTSLLAERTRFGGRLDIRASVECARRFGNQPPGIPSLGRRAGTPSSVPAAAR